MSQTFKEIRQAFPGKFLLLENYQERTVSANQIEIFAAESAQPYDTLREVVAAYRETKQAGRNVLYCTPRYVDSFIIERQPSARVLG